MSGKLIQRLIWVPSERAHRVLTVYGSVLIIMMLATKFIMDWQTGTENALEHKLEHQREIIRELLFYKMREVQLGQNEVSEACHFTSVADYNLFVQSKKSTDSQSICISMLASEEERQALPEAHKSIRADFFEAVDNALQLRHHGRDHRVTLILTGGKVIGDSHTRASKMREHRGDSERPELHAALKDGISGIDVRESSTTGEYSIYVAEPLVSDHDGNVRVVLRVAKRLGFFSNLFFKISNPILYGIGPLLFILFGGFLKRIVVSVLNGQEEAA